MYLSAAVPMGITPRAYAGMARDLSTLSVHFKPWMGRLDCFYTFVAGSSGKDPSGFVAPPPFCRWSWKRVPFPSAKGLGILVNTLWQKTVNDCHISLVFCSFQLAIFRLRSDYIFRKKLRFLLQNSFEILNLLTRQSTLLCPQGRGVSLFLLNNLGFGQEDL